MGTGDEPHVLSSPAEACSITDARSAELEDAFSTALMAMLASLIDDENSIAAASAADITIWRGPS